MLPSFPPPNSLIPTSGAFIASMGDYINAHCVYQHHDADARCQYVGFCKLTEVFNFADARNNTEWQKMFNGTTPLEIRIVFIGQRINDCINKRAELVRTLQPHCNIHGWQAALRIFHVYCNETRETFPTVSAAARAHDLTQSALSNHLAGKTGFRSVKGRTYRRIEPQTPTGAITP